MTTSTTVRAFAQELRKSPESLLEQLAAAGVHKIGAEDRLYEADKLALLNYLRAQHTEVAANSGGGRKEIVLVKRQADSSHTDISFDPNEKEKSLRLARRQIKITVRNKVLVLSRDGDVFVSDATTEKDGGQSAVLIGSIGRSLYDSVLRFMAPITVVPAAAHVTLIIRSLIERQIHNTLSKSQKQLGAKSRKSQRAVVDSAFFKLMRFDHLLPNSAATVALA